MNKLYLGLAMLLLLNGCASDNYKSLSGQQLQTEIMSLKLDVIGTENIDDNISIAMYKDIDSRGCWIFSNVDNNILKGNLSTGAFPDQDIRKRDISIVDVWYIGYRITCIFINNIQYQKQATSVVLIYNDGQVESSTIKDGIGALFHRQIGTAAVTYSEISIRDSEGNEITRIVK